MIPLSQQSLNTQNWRQQMAEAFSEPVSLLRFLQLPVTEELESLQAHHQFPLKVPRYYAELMEKGKRNDPLLLQVLPQSLEMVKAKDYSKDPTGDQKACKGLGLLQKYHGRALLITTQSCAIHCRYCFRRHFPYADQQLKKNQWQGLIQALAEDSSIQEVILSGGDPLSLSNQRLKELINAIAAIKHVRRLRIHSRTPVVLPARLDAGLSRILSAVPLPISLVLHINHPNEITPILGHALQPLRQSGVTMLNQSVLLKNINDQFETLEKLSNKMFNYNILPYYIHALDKVEGATHFQVSDKRALELHAELRNHLPGYLVPRLVREVPGAASKQPV